MPKLRKLGVAVASAGAATTAAAMVHGFPAITALPAIRGAFFPRLSGLGKKGHLALTFDDGPDPKSTGAFLEELDRLGWRATFFLLGVMVERDPGLAREVAAAGHEVALHGYDHRNHLWRNPLDVLGDLRRGFDAIAAATGIMPTFFRPPYGVLTTAGWASARLVGVRPVLWGAWGQDWRAEATAETVVSDLLSGMGVASSVSSRASADPGNAPRLAAARTSGQTLLLHDSDCTSEVGAWRSALGALAILADWASAGGWEVGPLSAHWD